MLPQSMKYLLMGKAFLKAASLAFWVPLSPPFRKHRSLTANWGTPPNALIGKTTKPSAGRLTINGWSLQRRAATQLLKARWALSQMPRSGARKGRCSQSSQEGWPRWPDSCRPPICLRPCSMGQCVNLRHLRSGMTTPLLGKTVTWSCPTIGGTEFTLLLQTKTHITTTLELAQT